MNIKPLLSSDHTVNKNIRWAMGNSLFRSAWLTLASGTVLQIFLLSNGVSETQLGLGKLLAYSCTVLGYIVFMHPSAMIGASKLVHTHRRTLACLFILPLSAFSLGLVSGSLSSGAFFALFCGMWMLSCFFCARSDIITYRLDGCIYEPGVYGKVFGLLGIVSGVLSVILGGAIAPVMKITNEKTAYCIIFASAAALAAGAYLTAGHYEPVRDPVTPDSPTVFHLLRETVGDARSRRVVIIHILRGASSGITYFLVPAGLRFFGIETLDVGYITVLATAAGFAANIFIFFGLDRLGVVKTSVLSVAVQVASLLPLIIFQNKPLFMGMFFLFTFGSLVLATAMPVGVLRVIEPQKLAAVTSLRLLIFQLTDSLMSFCASNRIMQFFGWFIIAVCVLKAVKLALIAVTFRER